MMRFPLCLTCRYFDRSKPGMHCEAFPDGIPDAIADCQVQHREPYPGDGGLQYEFDPDWPAKARISTDTEPDPIFG